MPLDQRSRGCAVPRIVHLTDSYDGGVGRAINDIVSNAPGFDHALVYHGDETPPRGLFASERKVVGGHLSRMRQFRRALRSSGASLAHLHSSWVGGFVRLGRKPPIPLIYQPHCYKFVDPSLPRARAHAFRLLERVFLSNTAATVVLSPAERQAAVSLGADRIVEVPNVPTVPLGDIDSDGSTLRRIMMVGRLSDQKDPAFFEQVVREVRRACPEVEAMWVGDGDERMRGSLLAAGVRITGWVDLDGVARLLSEGGVYIHSARYEGLPLAVLDAVQRGLPVVLRRVPSLVGFLEQRQSSTATEAAAEALRLFRSRSAYRSAVEQGRACLDKHSAAQQQKELLALYTSLMPC